MKRFTITSIIFLSGFVLSVSAQDIYGIHWTGNHVQYICAIDHKSGNITKLQKLAIDAHGMSSSTFNDNQKRYVFMGRSNIDRKNRIYINQTPSGAQVDSIFPNRYLFGTLYDFKSHTVFALSYDVDLERNYFLQINLNGKITVIDTLPFIKGVKSSAAVIDPYYRHYHAIVHEASGQIRLWTIDLQTGHIKSKLPVDKLLKELQFDLLNNRIVGLKNIAPEKPDMFLSYDLSTGKETILDTLEGTYASMTGSSTFDQENQLYFYLGIDKARKKRIYTINASNGKILYKPEFQEYFSELEVDNSVFMKKYFKDTKPQPEINFGIHPNPAINHIILTELNEGPNEISIYDLRGNLIKSVETDLAPGQPLKIDLQDEEFGKYILTVKTNDGVESKVIWKR